MDSVQDNFLIDDLLADSLKAVSYLKQVGHCRLQVLDYDCHEWMRSYLRRYWQASPEIQTQIFLFSGFYVQKEVGESDRFI